MSPRQLRGCSSRVRILSPRHVEVGGVARVTTPRSSGPFGASERSISVSGPNRSRSRARISSSAIAGWRLPDWDSGDGGCNAPIQLADGCGRDDRDRPARGSGGRLREDDGRTGALSNRAVDEQRRQSGRASAVELARCGPPRPDSLPRKGRSERRGGRRTRSARSGWSSGASGSSGYARLDAGGACEQPRFPFGTKGSQVRILSPRHAEGVGVAEVSSRLLRTLRPSTGSDGIVFPGSPDRPATPRDYRCPRISLEGALRMKLKRLFQVVVLGGAGLLAACGGSDGSSNNKPSGSTPPPQSLLPDGGTPPTGYNGPLIW